MKTQILLIGFLCMFTCNLQAQVQRRQAILHPGSERTGDYFNLKQSGFKPEQIMVPAKRDMFNPSTSVWK
ncbi:MAG: hypothetical protein WCL00_12040, partial [Bacteroidota bacterium]